MGEISNSELFTKIDYICKALGKWNRKLYCTELSLGSRYYIFHVTSHHRNELHISRRPFFRLRKRNVIYMLTTGVDNSTPLIKYLRANISNFETLARKAEIKCEQDRVKKAKKVLSKENKLLNSFINRFRRKFHSLETRATNA